MKVQTDIWFVCEICGEKYHKMEDAQKCERRETKQPKYAVGDLVTILTGDGAGKRAKITKVFYYEPSWAGERYAHKVGYHADIIGSWGSRQLIEGESV